MTKYTNTLWRPSPSFPKTLMRNLQNWMRNGWRATTERLAGATLLHRVFHRITIAKLTLISCLGQVREESQGLQFWVFDSYRRKTGIRRNQHHLRYARVLYWKPCFSGLTSHFCSYSDTGGFDRRAALNYFISSCTISSMLSRWYQTFYWRANLIAQGQISRNRLGLNDAAHEIAKAEAIKEAAKKEKEASKKKSNK